MRSLVAVPVAFLLALGTVACSDTLSPENLAGTYDVTTFELVNPANPSQTVEILGGECTTLTAVITAAGGFTFTCDGAPVVGTIAIEGDSVTIALAGEPLSGTISRDGDTVTVHLDGTYDWDDNSNTPETAADIRIVMTKTS